MLNWDPALPRRGCSPSQFRPVSIVAKMAGCTKIPHGMEVGLGPGDFVLDGDPAVPKRGTSPIFGPCLLWPNGWMDQDATSPLPRKGHSNPPLFGPYLCLLWPQSPISATAELLSVFLLSIFFLTLNRLQYANMHLRSNCLTVTHLDVFQ